MPREASMSEATPNPANRLPDGTVTETRAAKESRRRMIMIGVAVAVIVILIIAGFVGMIVAGTTGVWRDVIIILMGLESLMIGGLTLFLIYQVMMLVRLLRDEVTPLIKSAQDTVNSARGTTAFVGKKIVAPTITVSSNMARLTRMMRVLFKGKQ